MPMPVVSPNLFNAQALAADPADTHLQPGIHLRVAANPQLGLPVAPFVVHRAISKGDDLSFRTDAVFQDSTGAILRAPFNLTRGNPVTALLTLGPGEVCLWACVDADPGSPPGRPGTITWPPGKRPPFRPPVGRPGDALRADVPGAATRADGSAATGVATQASRAAAAGVAMAVTAFTWTAQGPSPVGTRTAPPFAIGAPGIVQLRIEGDGYVQGVRWLEQGELPRFNWVPWTILNLPHKGGSRYLSVDGALALAAARVLQQAPRRTPLQETLGMVPPSAAPLATPVEEAKRVESLARPLAPSLETLVNDLSLPPLELMDNEGINWLTGGGPSGTGTATQRCLDRVLAGTLDPGSAALMGYKALDPEWKEPGPYWVFYWVSGLFRDFPPSAAVTPDPIVDAELAVLPPEARVGDPAGVVAAFTDLLGSLPVKIAGDPANEMEPVTDYIGIGAIAVADRGSILLPMPAPVVDGVTDGGWLPVTPPDARREVEVALSGVGTASLLAASRQVPDGGTWASLNPVDENGYHLPFVLGMNADDETSEPPDAPGTGFLADRRATDDPIRYAVAQQDPFGRWSGWVSTVSSPGPRPGPPRPVILAQYTPPTPPADPATTGGAIWVRTPVPALDALAPGAFPIAQLEITIADATLGTSSVSVLAVPDPLAPVEELVLDTFGPVLAPTERRELVVTAVWRDTAGRASAPCEPVTLAANDPRPPTQPTVPDTLQYSGRPDALGLSMVEYTWPTTAGQAGFGVYYSDENRLVAALAGAASGSEAATVRDALAATTDPAARATLFRDHAGLFPGGLFERLKGVVTVGTGTASFRHAVSGSLRLLNVYRVAAESASNAKPDLDGLPLLIVAVPNADPPTRPVLAITPGDPAEAGVPFSVQADVSVTVGMTPAETVRLRRSSLGATEVARMPIVGTWPIPPADGDARQRVTVLDTGPVLISATATLKPWVRYTYVAEVQGAPAPGSVAAGRPVPGAWSAPSDPVSVLLVPPAAPQPASSVTVAGSPVGGGASVDVVVTVTTTEVLSGGVAGAYRIRVARRVPDGAFETLGELPTGGGEGPYAVSGMRAGDAADQVPGSTLYRVWIIDPLGRESGPAEGTLP